MAKLFDMHNPVWRFMGRLADIFLLTILWTVCSLPVITIGASTTALYYVTLKIAEGKEGYLIKGFFHAFKENFGHSTLVWLIMLALGIFFGWDFYYYCHLQGKAAILLFWIFFVLAVVYLFVLAMIFPLAARVDAGIKKLFFMAFMVSMKNFSWVMLMIVLAVCALAVAIFVFWPVFLFLAGGIACIHSFILIKAVFPQYGWTLTNELNDT